MCGEIVLLGQISLLGDLRRVDSEANGSTTDYRYSSMTFFFL